MSTSWPVAGDSLRMGSGEPAGGAALPITAVYRHYAPLLACPIAEWQTSDPGVKICLNKGWGYCWRTYFPPPKPTFLRGISMDVCLQRSHRRGSNFQTPPDLVVK